MKTLATALLFLTFGIPGIAQESPLLAVLGQLPTCAVNCLATAAGVSSCKITDLACLCNDAQLKSDTEACVLQTCTLKESLTTQNVTSTMCGAPIRSRVETLRATNIALVVVSASFVLMRVIYKLLYSETGFGWDDYLIVATLLCGVPMVIVNDRGTLPNGLGRDIWTLQISQIISLIKFVYVTEILYFLDLALLRLSLLFFYARIFPQGIVSNIIKGTIAFNVFMGMAFVLAAIFQCQPISHYWLQFDGDREHQGKCKNINALGWSNAAIGIALDIWMLAIPLSQLRHLRLTWKKKVGVALMFFVGTFVTVVSILRLQSLTHINTMNPTWDYWDSIMWSTIELNVGIMCACMPVLRLILVRLFPKIMGSVKSGSSKYYARKYKSMSKETDKNGGSWSAETEGGLLGRLGTQKGGGNKDAEITALRGSSDVAISGKGDIKLVQMKKPNQH